MLVLCTMLRCPITMKVHGSRAHHHGLASSAWPSARQLAAAPRSPACVPQCTSSTIPSACCSTLAALPSAQSQRCWMQQRPHLTQMVGSRHSLPMVCAAANTGDVPITTEDDVVRVATIGDIVTIHFTCKDVDGNVLESSHNDGEPISFELGAGDIMGNRLFKGFDEAIRGLAEGQMTVVEAVGGEWQRELLFQIPRDHPEVQRLEGRYKNQGGLQKDMLVELANGQLAVVVDMNDSSVAIDCNNMMAGKSLTFELEVLKVEKPKPE